MGYRATCSKIVEEILKVTNGQIALEELGKEPRAGGQELLGEKVHSKTAKTLAKTTMRQMNLRYYSLEDERI